MTMKVRKSLKPIKDVFNNASLSEKQEILLRVKLANKIIEDDLKKGSYNKSMKANIKEKSKPFRELEEELEEKLK